MKSNSSPHTLWLIVAIVCSAVLTTVLVMKWQLLFALISGIVLLVCCVMLNHCFVKNSRSLVSLLNAIEHNDFSLRFSEYNRDAYSRNINKTLNKIKEILINARTQITEQEKFLAVAVETVSTGIIIVEEGGSIRNANRAARQLLSLPVLKHIKQLSFVEKGLEDRFMSMQENESLTLRVETERDVRQLNVRLTYAEIQSAAYRIFTLNNIESELEAHETESWIRLIRVMTHEIMNSVAPITSISETLLQSLNESATQVAESDCEMLNTGLDTIRSTGHSLLNFVQDYRRFTSVPVPERIPFDAGTYIDEVLALMDDLRCRRGIEVMTEVPDGCLLNADRKLMLQVLINLVKNAYEATYPANVTPRVIISCRIQSGGEAFVSVINNGNPIPPDVLPNIFIPFYSTKENGSGIGLSLSRYIIRRHNGNLVHLRQGGNTIFRIEL